MRRATQIEHSPFGVQVAFARTATGLGIMGLGALAVGAVAIGALAIRVLAVKRGKIERLEIEELEVGRLRVRELVVEQERTTTREVDRDGSVEESAAYPNSSYEHLA